MMPLETLAELLEIATAPWSPTRWSHAAAPTVESLVRIQHVLGIHIPDDFVHLAAVCPSYGSWLASIGDDFDNGFHITRLNELFHDGRQIHNGAAGPALPPHLVIFNHGHDGDCDCWNTSVVTKSGEHPIVYVCLDAQAMTLESSSKPFPTFRSYAEHFALHHASRVPDKAQRRRAKRLIQELQGH